MSPHTGTSDLDFERLICADYPISPTLFHWQSQSGTREDSPTGRRNREHAQRGSHVLLFVRRRKQDDR